MHRNACKEKKETENHRGSYRVQRVRDAKTYKIRYTVQQR